MAYEKKSIKNSDEFCGEMNENFEQNSDAEMAPNLNDPNAWRRIMIERAVNNVKKAYEQKADVHTTYKRGSLIFDDEMNKFGRVHESRPGYLSFSHLQGGKEIVRQDLDQLEFVRENRQKMTLPELAQELFLSEIEVMAILNQIELESENAKKPASKAQTKKVAGTTKATKKSKKPEVSAKLPKSASSSKIKIAAKKSSVEVVGLNKSMAESNATFTKLLPKGATTDPIMDPNGYIQQNFLMMNNKELAIATGLSEHTVRRKLGEWGLKRRDFVNKA